MRCTDLRITLCHCEKLAMRCTDLRMMLCHASNWTCKDTMLRKSKYTFPNHGKNSIKLGDPLVHIVDL